MRLNKKNEEYFFIADQDKDGKPIKHRAVNKTKLIKYSGYAFLSVNSFYLPERNQKCLNTLYNICIDLDGWDCPYPLSQLDIREKFNDLGFSKEPSKIIRTSEGRFHVILSLDPLKAFPDKISYWKKCARGICKAFEEFGVDYGASTNPAGYYRVAGQSNNKYPNNQVTSLEFESKSIFRLSEIHNLLIENNLVKERTKKKYKPNSEVFDLINIIEGGVCSGARNNAVFSLAIHYKNQGLNYNQAFSKLIDWNYKNIPPLPEKEITSAIKSAYNNNYNVSPDHLRRIVDNSKYHYSNRLKPKIVRQPKIKKYAEDIRSYLLERNGYVEMSQRQLAKELTIPWGSFYYALKRIEGIEIKIVKKGRYSISQLRIIKSKVLFLNQKKEFSMANFNG